jgi:parallel beta-helix repeat protein
MGAVVMNKKLISIILVSIFLLTSIATTSSAILIKAPLMGETMPEEDSNDAIVISQMYEEHDFIQIEGNDDFTAENGIRRGSGTKNDPYIISNWITPAMQIRNTDAYFNVEDCFFTGEDKDNDYERNIYFYNVANAKIKDNCTIEPGNSYSMYLSVVRDCYIEYCDFLSNNANKPQFIYMMNSPDNEINNCNFYYGYSNCITLDSSNYNRIYDCTFDADVGKRFNSAIVVSESSYNEISDCTINDCNSEGIKLDDAENNNIFNCLIEKCSNGIRSVNSSYQNTITNCEISRCGVGIRTKSTTISKCEIWLCEIGIDTTGLSGNRIFHNNIYDNVFEAKADFSSNTWDNGSVGNYWDKDTYEGTDIDKNGRGDTPHKITILNDNNQDRYPLINKYGIPSAPRIGGLNKGNVDSDFPFLFTSYDFDGDDVYFYIEWGDGSPDEKWVGPYNYESGDYGISIKHKFNTQNKFTIRAKAKDTDGNESGWTSFRFTAEKTKITKPLLSYFERYPLLYNLLTKLSKHFFSL